MMCCYTESQITHAHTHMSHTHTHTHTQPTCRMVILMLVEVSPSPMATDPVVGRKSSRETASWSVGSPEAIAVLEE